MAYNHIRQNWVFTKLRISFIFNRYDCERYTRSLLKNRIIEEDGKVVDLVYVVISNFDCFLSIQMDVYYYIPKFKSFFKLNLFDISYMIEVLSRQVCCLSVEVLLKHFPSSQNVE